MAWVAGADVLTGDLITAAQWNNYLGAAGSIEYLKTETDKLDDITHTEPVRAVDTVYQNVSGKLRLVTVTVSLGGVEQANFLCDAGAAPADIIARAALDDNATGVMNYIPVSFWIPLNWYYEMETTVGTPGIYQWHEWDLF